MAESSKSMMLKLNPMKIMVRPQILRVLPMRNKQTKQKKWTASKLMILAVIIISIEILAYAEWIMYNLGNIDALYVLIGIPASLATSLVAYFKKSRAENTKGGIVYDMAMKEWESCEDEGIEDEELVEEDVDEALDETAEG